MITEFFVNLLVNLFTKIIFWPFIKTGREMKKNYVISNWPMVFLPLAGWAACFVILAYFFANARFEITAAGIGALIIVLIAMWAMDVTVVKPSFRDEAFFEMIYSSLASRLNFPTQAEAKGQMIGMIRSLYFGSIVKEMKQKHGEAESGALATAWNNNRMGEYFTSVDRVERYNRIEREVYQKFPSTAYDEVVAAFKR